MPVASGRGSKSEREREREQEREREREHLGITLNGGRHSFIILSS